MPSIAAKRIDRILSGKQLYPFDFVNNPIFFDPKPVWESEQAQRLLALTKIANIAADSTSRGLKYGFVPGSMSNGYEATLLVEDYRDKVLQNTRSRFGEAFLTTQRAKHNIAGQELMDRVILPMRLQNHQLVDAAERLYPDAAIVGPVDFEGPVRMTRTDNALLQGGAFQDWTFEHWWVPRVIGSSFTVLGGDHAYSRYANPEEFTADLIQCGLLDEYRGNAGPGKEYDIVDLHKQQVPLADRAWETAKHIVDVVERGFRSDFAVAALAVRFQIDDWLRDKDGPLDKKKLHPTLRMRDGDEIQRMDRLKELMLPYIAQKCAAWMPYKEDVALNAYFEENVLPVKEPLSPADIKALRKELFAYQPRGGFVHPVYGAGKSDVKQRKQDLTGEFAVNARSVKRRGTDGIYYARKSGLFENNHFEKLKVWEQAAIRFLIGCMETHRLPENAPNAAFYACEPEGGLAAKVFSDKHGISYLKEAQIAENPMAPENFNDEVVGPNVARDLIQQEKIAREKVAQGKRIANVVSTLDFLDIRDAAEDLREFVAAPGASRLSSKAMLALETEWLDRNAQTLVLRQGWQYHNNEVELMLRAVLHATGQIDRPPSFDGGKHRMEIFVHNPDAKKPEDRMKKQDLYDLVMTLGKTVEEQLDCNPHVPDRVSYLTCARLLEIIDKLGDPGRRNYRIEQNGQTGKHTKTDHEIINWTAVDRDLWKFWTMEPDKKAELSPTRAGQAETLRDRLTARLKQVGVLEFTQDDLEGLSEDYQAAWNEAHAADENLRRTDRPREQIHDWRIS